MTKNNFPCICVNSIITKTIIIGLIFILSFQIEIFANQEKNKNFSKENSQKPPQNKTGKETKENGYEGFIEESILFNSYNKEGLWALGLEFHEYDSNGGGEFGTVIHKFHNASLGLKGCNDENTINHFYMAFGEEPWNSGKGLYIKPDGKAGIGTTSPSELLDVEGNARIAEDLKLDGSVSSVYFTKQEHSSRDVGRGLRYINTDGTSRAGIGLKSVGISRLSIDKEKNENKNFGDIGFQNTNFISSRPMPATNQLMYMAFGESPWSSGKGIYVMSDGNVGIGTNRPNEKLDVSGNILIRANNYLRFGKEDSNTGYFEIHNATCCYNTYADIKGNLYFRTEASQATMGIQKNNTITMGVWPKYGDVITDTQGFRLMVKGGILTDEVKIIHNVPSSDYVFESDYNLLSLKEVEKFIKENKHLPEVPSAREFKENGYNIAEMDDILLRKVEELTLYLIELNKRIETLEKENDILKAKD